MKKQPTCTSLVLEALTVADDFMTVVQLIEATRLTASQVTAALFHLRKHRVVDIVEGDGLWWFATPDSDNRCRCVNERKPEVNKRKPHKSRKVES